jgi:hypothetical protein
MFYELSAVGLITSQANWRSPLSSTVSLLLKCAAYSLVRLLGLSVVSQRLAEVVEKPQGDITAEYGGFARACEELSGAYYSCETSLSFFQGPTSHLRIESSRMSLEGQDLRS